VKWSRLAEAPLEQSTPSGSRPALRLRPKWPGEQFASPTKAEIVAEDFQSLFFPIKNLLAKPAGRALNGSRGRRDAMGALRTRGFPLFLNNVPGDRR